MDVMKKILIVLLLLLCACSSKENYFELSIDDYSITVGKNDVEYLQLAFDVDVPETIESKQTLENVGISLFNNVLGVADISNTSNSNKSSTKAVLTKFTVYLKDIGDRSIKLNGEELNSSVKVNCDKYNGTYIEKNGHACVIDTQVDDKLNVVELHGDYLNINQDELDHIIVYVK